MVVSKKKWFAVLVAVMMIGIACTGDGGTETEGEGEFPVTEGLTDDTQVPLITLVGPGTNYDAQQFEANSLVLENFERLGLETEYKTAADPTGVFALIESEEEDMASLGFLGTLLRTDPDELMSRPYLCDFAVEGGSNFAFYCNPEYDEIVLESKKTYDFEERRDLLLEAQAQIARDVPTVTTYHPTQFDVYNSEAYGNVQSAVAVGLYNFWNFYQAEPLGQDKIYRLGMGGDLINMNPLAQEAYSSEAEMAQNVTYDTLTKIDLEAKVVPWAAETYEALDEQTIEAKLHDDMTFHDGRPVTAADVKFSYEYIKEHEIGLYINALASLDRVEVVDPQTVRFHLSEPSAVFPHSAMSQIPILPKHIWENVLEENNLDHPSGWQKVDFTGSGPYELKSANLSEGVEWVRNDDYWAGPAGSEGFILKPLADSQALLRDLQDGGIYFHQTDTLLANAVNQAREDARFTVQEVPGLTVRWFSFVMKEGQPFEDFHLRHALSHVVDYDTIVDAIIGGDGVRGTGNIAPGNETWHNDAIEFAVESDEAHWHDFSMEHAQQILEDAGYRWDEEGNLHFPEDHEPQLLCEC